VTPPRTLELPSDHNYTIGIQVPKDVDLKQVIKKVQEKIGDKEKEVQRLEGRLASPEFRGKAEPSVIQESEDRLAKIQDELDILKITEKQLTSMTA
jgi:valyl-tRNA synthetase